MLKTLRAKYTKGIIKPLEKLHLKEGKEITIVISEPTKQSRKKNAIEATFGAWKGLMDKEAVKKGLAENRRISRHVQVKA